MCRTTKELDETLSRDNFSPSIRDYIIKTIYIWSSLYPSKEHVLKRMFLDGSHNWVDGELKIDYKEVEKDEKEISLNRAKEIYLYGYQNHPVFFSYLSSYAPLFKIPKDIKPEWLNVVTDFLFYINNIKEKEYKLLLLANRVKYTGINNPHTYASFNSDFENFKELRVKTNQLAKDMGFEHISVDSLHDPIKVRGWNSKS